MRAVLSVVADQLDFDIHSVQYSKTSKAVCHCFIGRINDCVYSRLMADNSWVIFHQKLNNIVICINSILSYLQFSNFLHSLNVIVTLFLACPHYFIES